MKCCQTRTLIVWCALLALCGGQLHAAHTSNTQAKQVFSFNNHNLPTTLDPGKAHGIYERQVINQVFEGLTTQDPETLAIRPGLALSWKKENAGKRYIFRLNPKAMWSDGKPITASDFVFAWRRVLHPKTKAHYATQLYYIKNARQYNGGKKIKVDQLGVKAIDPYTLQVDLENATPYFLQLTAFYTLFPVPQHWVERLGERWTEPKNIVCSGPFCPAPRQGSSYLRLLKNKRYYDAARVHLNEIHVYGIKRPKTVMKLYRNGKIDFTGETPLTSTDVSQWRYTPDFHTAPWFAVNYLRFNTTRAPFNDLRVRKAISLAINRNRITRYIISGDHLPAKSMVPDGMSGYRAIKSVAYDLRKALKLLSEAGYCVPGNDRKGCKRFPRFAVLLHNHEGHTKLMLAVQQMLSKNLGIKTMQLDVAKSWGDYLKRVASGDFDMARSGWTGDYFDPNTFLELWESGHPHNNTGYANPEYDALLEKAAKSLSPKRRMQYLRRAEALLLDQMPVTPIYHYTTSYLVKPYVHNFAHNLRKILMLKSVYIEYYTPPNHDHRHDEP